LLESAAFTLLLFLSETLHLVVKNAIFVSALGFAVLRVAAWSAAVWLLLAPLLAVTLKNAAARSLLFSAFFYAVLSAKVLAVDASFLHRPAPLAVFVVGSCVPFGIAYGCYRYLRDTSVFPLTVLVYFNALKWLGHGWATRGGNLKAFLVAKETLAIGVGAALALVLLLVLLVRYGRLRGWLAASVALGLCLVILARSETVGAREHKSSGSDRPEIVVLSFDALRKDVFDEHCKKTASSALKALCQRGRHYQNVISDGVSTYDILSRNIHGSGPCPESLPGQLSTQGYTTSMYLGRKLVNISGAFCFDRYYSGENRTLLEGYAIPSIVGALTSPQADTPRAKYIDSLELFDTFASDPTSKQKPLFVYFHFLDLHAPYVPSALAGDAAYLKTIGEFMARCYGSQCDLGKPENRRLLEDVHKGYLAALADIEKPIDRVMSFLHARNRPFRLILTADHGELFGEHNGIAHSGGFVPELLSVPFVVYDSDEASPPARDCRLLSSSEALAEASLSRKPSDSSTRTSLRIEGAPLGSAVIDIGKNSIDYTIAKDMLAHRGTWRNVHESQTGSVPFSTERCSAAALR
jgi:hypothetical protein